MMRNDYNNCHKHELFFNKMLIARGRNTAERSKTRMNKLLMLGSCAVCKNSIDYIGYDEDDDIGVYSAGYFFKAPQKEKDLLEIVKKENYIQVTPYIYLNLDNLTGFDVENEEVTAVCSSGNVEVFKEFQVSFFERVLLNGN